MILFNCKAVGGNIANYQPTDFSKVTAQPEFVLKGKKFYNETGQLLEGAADFNIIKEVQVASATVKDEALILTIETYET